MWRWFKKTEPPASLGQAGEQRAQEEYKKRGYEILAANFFNRQGRRVGEIDFIAKDGRTLAFVEVKTRRAASGKFGSGEEAVNFSKQRKILKAAKWFLSQNPQYRQLAPRIDVCVVEADPVDKTLNSVKILMNAVEDDR